MSVSGSLSVHVECNPGHAGEPTPSRFSFGGRVLAVTDVLDAWLARDHRYFKLLGSDGGCYILRHDVESGRWELTLFDRRGIVG